VIEKQLLDLYLFPFHPGIFDCIGLNLFKFMATHIERKAAAASVEM
jgi:hypothetical protein